MTAHGEGSPARRRSVPGGTTRRICRYRAVPEVRLVEGGLGDGFPGTDIVDEALADSSAYRDGLAQDPGRRE